MDARLQSLIDDYKAAVLRAVAELEASGIPRPATTTEWVGYDVPGRGKLTNGGDYFIHGFGCAVCMPGTTVDFDFGDDGQIDGFDWYRLATFAESKLHKRYRIQAHQGGKLPLHAAFRQNTHEASLPDGGNADCQLALDMSVSVRYMAELNGGNQCP